MEKILFLDGNENVKHQILFNSDENKIDKGNNISYLKDKIYDDDTILNIKAKLFNECQKIDSLRNVFIESMYLFAYKKVSINYNYFKKNMNKENYDKVLENFKSNDFEFEDKNYEEIMSYLETSYHKNLFIYELIPIGQKNISEKAYPVNPLKYTVNDNIRFSKDQNNVILEYYDFYENSIFVLDIESVGNTNIDLKDSIIKKYFIYSNVSSHDEYFINKDNLLNSSIDIKMLLEKYNIYNENIVKFKTDLDYDYFGINLCEIEISKNENIFYPIDILFKIFKTSKNIPYIKYNPSLREEKLNRLYTEDKRTYLNSVQIHRLQKIMNRNYSVQMYVKFENEECILSFLQNGSINIYFETENLYNLKQIEKYFVKYINPIIKNVQTLFQQYGYYYEVIGSLKDKKYNSEKYKL